MFRLLFAFLLFSSLSSLAQAHPLELIKLQENIYALIGPMEQRSPSNLANNANFGFIVTDEGVILIDSGGTLQGARAIEQAIGQVTNKPVIRVINTGGQDHRWFGNHYFTRQGAKTLTSIQTLQDQQAREDEQSTTTAAYTHDSWRGTQPEPAQSSIDQATTFDYGNITLTLIPVGPAHTGGETLVWLANEKILFSGDLVYLDRMLGIGPQSQHLPWIKAFAHIQRLNPQTIVPGHGHPGSLDKAEQDTLAYLNFLRQQVGQLLENGEDMSSTANIDQSQFKYLKVFQQIHGRNAQRVFAEMEWE